MGKDQHSKRLIELKNIHKTYDNKNMVLKDINLYIEKNEFVTLLGPSGCGKTTILRIIGGFETPTSGELLFEGKDILKSPPHKRRVNTVFQNYALFPHLNVFENIAFGLKIRKVDKKVIQKKVGHLLELISLENYEKRSVRSLSGGQQQRIAIARALANEPEALLLDEPLGALDLKLREEMQIELKNIHKELGITFIYVTHDQEEALAMSDTVVVLRDGIIQQIDTPKDIYDEPKNVFVANFIGKSNICDGVMLADFKVKIAGTQFECLDKGFGENEAVDIVIRPEDIRIVQPEQAKLRAIVKDIVFNGSHYAIYVEVKSHVPEQTLDEIKPLIWSIWSTEPAKIGAEIGLDMIPDALHVMRRT